VGQAFAPAMLAMRNSFGDTPLEALLFKLEHNRTRQERENSMARIDPTSDTFEGHSAVAVQCPIELKRMYPSTTGYELSKLTMGCTCGHCLCGFLSPCMRFALLSCA